MLYRLVLGGVNIHARDAAGNTALVQASLVDELDQSLLHHLIRLGKSWLSIRHITQSFILSGLFYRKIEELLLNLGVIPKRTILFISFDPSFISH